LALSPVAEGRGSLLAADEEEAELVALIDPLLDELDLAVPGQASGWSSVDVVAMWDLCANGMISSHGSFSRNASLNQGSEPFASV
jgi:hypothetical protein